MSSSSEWGNINGTSIFQVVHFLNSLIANKEFLEIINRPAGNLGGYFVVRDITNYQIMFIIRIGVCGNGWRKSLDYSVEKNEKLFDAFSRRSCVSSFQCQNYISGTRYTGAIVAGNTIISFSGDNFSGVCDEALMLAVAERFGWISENAAIEIAYMSDNQIYQAIKEKVNL